MDVAVYAQQCTNCNETFYFDGRKMGLLNFNNCYIFTCEMFYSLLDYKYSSGLPTNSWYSSQIISKYLRWSNVLEFYSEVIGINSNQLRSLKYLSGRVNRFFCQFLEILNQPHVSYSCCIDPKIITIDGIVLSVETKRIKRQFENYENPCHSGKGNENSR
jgi:hypothetical protein